MTPMQINQIDLIAALANDTAPVLGGNLNISSYGITKVFTSGGVTIGKAVYLASDGKVKHCSEASSSTFPCIGIALSSEIDGNPVYILIFGFFEYASYTFTTIGAPLYPTSTDGTLSQTSPSTSGDTVQRVAIVIESDVIFVNISLDTIELM